MDRHHALPVRVTELLDRVHELNPCVAHQNVDAAECLHHVRNAGIDCLLVCDIHRNRGCLCTGGTHLRSSGGCGVEIEIRDGHARALTRKSERDALAYAASRAGGNSGFTVQHHLRTSRKRHLANATCTAPRPRFSPTPSVLDFTLTKTPLLFSYCEPPAPPPSAAPIVTAEYDPSKSSSRSRKYTSPFAVTLVAPTPPTVTPFIVKGYDLP